jgi:sterol desaturase/sphingolipid hydroxylase (fatty acid hydroxylase superfamily)|tara:strand:+ start:1419 stop:1604 length:186 start_codon:yes stop_codon:yes gene_type:complete
MGILSKFWDKVTGTEKVKVRSRNKKGHYVADDKSTPDVNEAYTTVRKKRGRPAKVSIDNNE